jgi:hypothetical protein
MLKLIMHQNYENGISQGGTELYLNENKFEKINRLYSGRTHRYFHNIRKPVRE